MAKHLRQKSHYKLFSSKSAPLRRDEPAAETPTEPAVEKTAPEAGNHPELFGKAPAEQGRVPDISAADTELPELDMPDIEDGQEMLDLELDDVSPTSIEPDVQPWPSDKEEEDKVVSPESDETVKFETGPVRVRSKRPGRPQTPPEHKQTYRRTHRRRRYGRIALLAAAIILAAAAAVFAFLRYGAEKKLSPLDAGYVFSPQAVDSTKPEKFIASTAVMVNDGEVESYTASNKLSINFGQGSDYTSAKGITCFRGNNFRTSASYGTADLTAGKFTEKWSADTGSLTDSSGSTWTGSGWTGQPLIVCWPDSTREKMKSMYEWAREKDGLVEAIYPTMDGNIYFTELSTGKATRDPMYLGFTFKGTGTLDPRGYPILYVGSGVNSTAGKSRVFVINLLDCSVMYRFGYYESFSHRDWNMWDASPLVDAGTDQLIYPGENGILYIIHLNTLYDEAAGSLTVNPDNIVKWRYDSLRTTTYTYWSGFEASPVCWQGHIIMADNGGNLMCLDLNTLKLDWVSDVLDDTSCSPVLSVEEDGVYVYIGAAFHPGWRSDSSAVVPIWKINAVTGETIWKAEYTCTGDGGMSGGVQGTIAVGSKKLAGMIFVPIASTPDAKSGTLAALDTKTGKQLWKFDTNSYSWSSPADVYDEKGNGYLVYCTADGSMYLLDGLTGNKLDVFDLGGAVEASPAVYDDWAVIGTRGCKIWGVKLG